MKSEKGVGRSGKLLHFKGCVFHRVITAFMAQVSPSQNLIMHQFNETMPHCSGYHTSLTVCLNVGFAKKQGGDFTRYENSQILDILVFMKCYCGCYHHLSTLSFCWCIDRIQLQRRWNWWGKCKFVVNNKFHDILCGMNHITSSDDGSQCLSIFLHPSISDRPNSALNQSILQHQHIDLRRKICGWKL